MLIALAFSLGEVRDDGVGHADQVSLFEVETDLSPALAVEAHTIVRPVPPLAGTLPEIVDDMPCSRPAGMIFRPPRAAFV